MISLCSTRSRYHLTATAADQLARGLAADQPAAWLDARAAGDRNAHARTPGQIAEVLGISRTTATGVIDRLESEGLLIRSIDQADRRSFVLELTTAGRALIYEIDQFRQAQLQSALGRLDNSSLSALATGLQALVQQMQPTVFAAPPLEES